jgi:predicted HAD superfamily phosphohydrolase YqeG
MKTNREVSFTEILKVVNFGYSKWASKPHNHKLSKKLEGTPAPNDMAVNITDEIVFYLLSGESSGE